MSDFVSTPRRHRAARATRLIEDASADLDQQTLADAWGRGGRSYVSLQLSGHRKLRQSLLDTLYDLTKDGELVAAVKKAAIAAWLERRPDVSDPERASIDDVEVTP